MKRMTKRALHLKRVRAARKAWDTIDERYGRSGPAENAWKTRRAQNRKRHLAAKKAAKTRASR